MIQNKGAKLLLFTVALAGLLIPAAIADDTCPRATGRECQPTPDPCLSMDITTTTVQLGGEGSVGTEDECSSSPAKDAEGNVVEADLTYTWDRDPEETRGTLTILGRNMTCDPSISKITTIWFNTPTEIASCTLRTAELINPGEAAQNVCGDASCTTQVSGKSWSLGSDTRGEGCLGEFDWEFDTTGIQKGVLPGGQIEFVLDCTGAGGLDLLTACDIATGTSDADIGDRLAQSAMHFQNTDPQEGELSNKVSSNCQEDLYVDLASFDAIPDDSSVALEWRTAMEVDNAGFRILRRELATGRIEQLNPGMIPAEGDINIGATYRFVDATAINGVSYEYVLVDVELSGSESEHPGQTIVPNPPRPPIRLIGPTNGLSEIRFGDTPRFDWEADEMSGAQLLVSSDPTFGDRGRVLDVRVNQRSRRGTVELNRSQTALMEQLALESDGLLYWKIIQRNGRNQVESSSATFSLTYGVLDPADGTANGRALGRDRNARRGR